MADSKPSPMTDTSRMRGVIDHSLRRNLVLDIEVEEFKEGEPLASRPRVFGFVVAAKGGSAEPLRSFDTFQLMLVERLLLAEEGESGISGWGRSLDKAVSSTDSGGGLSWSTEDPSASLEDADGRPFMGAEGSV